MALHLLVFAVLQAIYHLYIVRIYGYQGYEDAFNPVKFGASFVVLLLLAMSIRPYRRVVGLLLDVTLVMAITPMFVIYAGADFPTLYAAITTLAFLVISLTTRLKLPVITGIHFKQKEVLHLLFLATLIFVASFYFLGAFRTLNFEFSEVYSLRRQVASALPGIYSYLIPLFTKSIIPIVVLLAAVHRRYVILLTAILCSFLLFGLTTHKGMLFYPAVTLFLYYTIPHFRGSRLFVGTVLGVLVLSAVDFLFYTNGIGEGWFSSLVARRVLLVPAQLNYAFFEFFSNHPWYLWSQSRITLDLVPMPYEVTAPLLIGQELFGRTGVSANVGWIGSGFANAGILGVVLYSVGVGLVFSAIETFSRKLGAIVVIPIFFNQVLDMLISTDFVTLFITHGLLFSFLVVMCLGKSPHQHVRNPPPAAGPI